MSFGNYYNTQSRVTFTFQQDPQTSGEKSNQRILSLTSLDPHQDQTRLTKCETSTRKLIVSN